MMQNQTTDILIIGGGTVGLSLAIDLLQSTDLTLAIVEAHAMDASDSGHPSLDSRCLALANKSHEYLIKLLGENAVLTDCPIEHIQVSDRGFVGKCYLHADEVNADHLGAVAPIQTIGRALLEQFNALRTEQPHRALWFSPNLVEHIEREQHCITARLDNGQTLSAKLVVFADGGRSQSKQLLGFKINTKDYEQTALIANVVCEKPHQNWAFERFTQTGPLALLPLDSTAFEVSNSHGVYSLVWTIDSDDTDNLRRLTDDDDYFLTQLSEYAGQRHGRFIQTSERSHYPLHLSYAERISMHRSIAIGNAAQALHPIAGQGFNLGLRDVQALTKLIVESSTSSRMNAPSDTRICELGDWAFTQQYEQLRKPDRTLIINATDTLVHSFSNHYWPLVLGRNAGLLLMNKLAPVKRFFARRAMGY